jgi:hypothetical protein
VLVRVGRYAEAVKDLDQAITLQPDRALSYYNRGNARVRLGDLLGEGQWPSCDGP